jgi:hypothetical protein
MIRRNVITNDYKVELDTINTIFGIATADIERREKGIKESLSLGHGGYLETIKLLNSLILGLICCIIWIYLNQPLNLFVFFSFVIGAAGGWFNQSLYAKICYRKDEKDEEKKSRKMKSNIENEYSVIICSSNPKLIVGEITKKTKIGNFEVQNKRELNITDSYFDICNLLQKNKFAFRLREENNKKLITLKGPPVNKDNNGIKRYEKELEWSKESFENIIDDIGTIIKNNIKDNSDDDAISFLRKIGFEDIQIRNTIRTVLDIIDNKDGKTKIIAELDVDEINYRLDTLDVSLFNVEIEKKDRETGDRVLRTIYNSLREEFGDDVLSEWKHGKLAIGKGIIELSKNGKLIPDENNYLNCSNLNDIEEYIKKGKI